MMGRGVRWTHALIAGLVGLLLSWVVGRWWMDAGHLPVRMPWLTVGVLLVAAGVVLWYGRAVRRYQRGKATRSLNPGRAAATLALAQAAILTGAFLVGGYAGQALLILPDVDFTPYQGRLWRLGVAALGAVAVLVSGAVVQSWCRVEPPEDDSRAPTSATS